MSTKTFTAWLAALAAAVAAGLYAALQFFTVGHVLLAVGIAAGCVVLLLALAVARPHRGGGRASVGSGGFWFDGGGHGGGWGSGGGDGGGGWGGGGDGGGGGGCGSS